MLTTTMDTKGLRVASFRSIDRLQRGIVESVQRGADAGVRHARTQHSHKRRTGRLTSTAHLKWKPVTVKFDAYVIELVNDAPYALYVEEGTKPHIIRPKEGHGFIGPLRPGQSRRAITDIGTHRVALRIPVGSGYIFRSFVNHPGSKPYPFMLPAAHQAERVIRMHIENVTMSKIAEIWN